MSWGGGGGWGILLSFDEERKRGGCSYSRGVVVILGARQMGRQTHDALSLTSPRQQHHRARQNLRPHRLEFSASP